MSGSSWRSASRCSCGSSAWTASTLLSTPPSTNLVTLTLLQGLRRKTTSKGDAKKYNFPMSPHVRLSVGRSEGSSVKFSKRRKCIFFLFLDLDFLHAIFLWSNEILGELFISPLLATMSVRLSREGLKRLITISLFSSDLVFCLQSSLHPI